MTFLGSQSKEKNWSDVFMVLFSARTGLIFAIDVEEGGQDLIVLNTTSHHCKG